MSGSQVSVVQGSLSSQALELSVWTHPVAGSQVSVVQRLSSGVSAQDTFGYWHFLMPVRLFGSVN